MSEKIAWPESETGYIRIKRKDIASYMTQEFFTLVDTYSRIKQYGWPQGKGYLAEARMLLELVTLFDDEKAHFKAFAEK